MIEKLKKLSNNYAFNMLVIVGLTGLVFWLTLKDNFDVVSQMMKSADWRILLLIVGMMVAERWLHGWGIMKTIRISKPDYKWSQGFINAYVAGFFNAVTPSASGGQFAQVFIFRRQGVRVHEAVSTLWLDFVIYQSTMIALVLFLILLRFHYFYSNYSQFFALVIFGFLISSAVIVGLWALVRFPRFYKWLTTKGIEIGCKLHLIKDREKTLEMINAQLNRFDEQVQTLHEHKGMIAAVAAEDLLRLLIYYSVPFFCAKALHIEIGLDRLLDVIALSSFVAMINCFLPMPGSSGGTEATFVLMFSTILGKVNASSIMVLWRLSTFYLTIIIGGLVYLYAKSVEAVHIDDLPEDREHKLKHKHRLKRK